MYQRLILNWRRLRLLFLLPKIGIRLSKIAMRLFKIAPKLPKIVMPLLKIAVDQPKIGTEKGNILQIEKHFHLLSETKQKFTLLIVNQIEFHLLLASMVHLCPPQTASSSGILNPTIYSQQTENCIFFRGF